MFFSFNFRALGLLFTLISTGLFFTCASPTKGQIPKTSPFEPSKVVSHKEQEVLALQEEASSEALPQQRQVSILPPTEEERQRYFYGPLQMRSDALFQEMNRELYSCLAQVETTGLRELAILATRAGVGTPFELADLQVNRGEIPPCAAPLAQQFIAFMGSGPWDGFDSYGVAILLPPETTDSCTDGGYCQHLTISSLPDFWPESSTAPTTEPGGPIEEEPLQCDPALVDVVNRFLRQGRHRCVRPRNFEEVPFEDPLLSRIVITGHLKIDSAGLGVHLFLNHSWALGAATCLLEAKEKFIDEIQTFDPDELTSAASFCQAELSNLSVAYTEVPIFAFRATPD